MSPTSEGGARITRAMALAAGLGKRMRPLTDHKPKPLVEVGGVTLLDRVLDHFAAAGIEEAVVNTHYMGEMVAAHVNGRTAPRIVLSPEEDELLDTGGGVQHALDKLGDAPFLVANSDALWVDGYQSALRRLMAGWDGDKMDALLMVFPTIAAVGYGGRGDFTMDSGGRLQRRRELEVAPYVFAGVQILHPRLFDGAPGGKYSLNLLYDRALRDRRLFGLRHDGDWYHVGTPDSITQVERILSGQDGRLDWV